MQTRTFLSLKATLIEVVSQLFATLRRVMNSRSIFTFTQNHLNEFLIAP